MLLKTETADRIKITLVGLIDATFTFCSFLLLFYFNSSTLPLIILHYPSIFIFFGFIVYRFIGIFFFDGTIGMKIFKVTLLNENEEPLSFKEIILASMFILFRGVEYYSK